MQAVEQPLVSEVSGDVPTAVASDVTTKMQAVEQPLVSEEESVVNEEKPMPPEEQKEPKEDPIKTALLEQLKQIEEQTNQIKSQLMTAENAAAAGGGGVPDNSSAAVAAVNKIMKKRRKTFYKKYKSKISMKRKNKTNRK
jgi:hypothetical protein